MMPHDSVTFQQAVDEAKRQAGDWWITMEPSMRAFMIHAAMRQLDFEQSPGGGRRVESKLRCLFTRLYNLIM